jgi:uncharacterized protein (TIGR02246 family)
MKFLMILMGVVCLLFVLPPSCAPPPEEQVEPVAEEAPSTEADVEAIRGVNQQCLAAINSGDADTCPNLFTDDGVFMPPNEPMIIGKDAIRAWLQTAMDSFTFDNTWSSEEIVVFGDWAFDRGSSTSIITPKEGGESIKDAGKYIWILERQSDGSWKYARVIWNSDNPPPEEPTS